MTRSSKANINIGESVSVGVTEMTSPDSLVPYKQEQEPRGMDRF